MKSFKYWEIQDVEETFKLRRIYRNYPLLVDWLTASDPITTADQQRLDTLIELLHRFVDLWNEEELKMGFIAPLLALVNFEADAYRLFFNRALSVEINGEKLGGIVDMVVATGRQKPRKPLFFLHEYKAENKRDIGDPLGQLMAEMVAAQAINQDGRPIYGGYVSGRNWFFVVLHESEYGVSAEYVATRPADLVQIVQILRRVKAIITESLGAV